MNLGLQFDVIFDITIPLSRRALKKSAFLQWTHISIGITKGESDKNWLLPLVTLGDAKTAIASRPFLSSYAAGGISTTILSLLASRCACP